MFYLWIGFIFGVSSKCTLDDGVTTSIFYASITLHYGDNENSNYKVCILRVLFVDSIS